MVIFVERKFGDFDNRSIFEHEKTKEILDSLKKKKQKQKIMKYDQKVEPEVKSKQINTRGQCYSTRFHTFHPAPSIDRKNEKENENEMVYSSWGCVDVGSVHELAYTS